MTGISTTVLASQILLGLVNGAFYALLSLGLSVIFGLLHIANFVHGAQFMMGAFVMWIALNWFGIGYWGALILAPVIVGSIGALLEIVLLRRIYDLDHFYGLLMTFGMLLMIESMFRYFFGSAGIPYPNPMPGVINAGFMVLPYYRLWVVLASLALSLATWIVIERTRVGSYLRAATENPTLVSAFGINVPRLLTLTYAAGVGLAALAGAMAAPIQSVNPTMGSSIITTIFAIVVIGGMGSIIGSIVTGLALGVVEGLTKVIYPEGASVAVFVVMALVLIFRPAGLFGRVS